MTTQHKVVIRLTDEVFRHIESKCPAPVVTHQTTDLQAGFQLGVQHVLKLLRDGVVVPG